jgi:hypothetical protein
MKLYYLTSADYAVSNIALRRLKISRISDLNDPFELLAADLTDKEFRRAIKSWKRELNKTTGLLCFSESWRNPVLWGHYGDRHRGICLGFDVPEKDTMPVNYSNSRVKIKFKNNDPKQGLSKDFVNELLRTKYEHWVYEKERRIFIELDETTKENGNFFFQYPELLSLSEVIIGPHCEIPKKQIEELTLKTHGPIRIIKARLGFENFEVVIDQRFEKDQKII